MKRLGRRDNSEKAIVNVLRSFGMSVFLMDLPCDLLCGYRGKTYLVEVKSGRKGYAKGLNDNQQDFADAWRGSPVVAIHSEDDAVAWAKCVAAGETWQPIGEVTASIVERLRRSSK